MKALRIFAAVLTLALSTSSVGLAGKSIETLGTKRMGDAFMAGKNPQATGSNMLLLWATLGTAVAGAAYYHFIAPKGEKDADKVTEEVQD